MISKVVMFPKINREKQFSLISPIDRSNKDLVKNFYKYIKKISTNSLLYRINLTDEKIETFIFNNIGIDDNIDAEQVYDVAFLTDGIEIIGHVISVFNISYFGGIKKVSSIISMEKCIPSEYSYLKLIEDYRKKRILLSSEKQYFIKKTIDLPGGITR